MRRIRLRALLAMVAIVLAIVAAAWYASNSAGGGVKADLDVAYRTDTPSPHNLLDVVYHGKRVPGGRPAVIIVHGGSWRAGDKLSYRKNLMITLARHGYVAVSINYRLSGVARFPAAVQDVKAAVRWLRANSRRYNVDPSRIGLWGSSSGAHLAALAAVTSRRDGFDDGPYSGVSSRVRCVVCRSGVYDLRPEANPVASRSPDRMAFLGGPPDQTRAAARRASPVVYLDRNDPPMLVIHGTKDVNIPYGAARHMVAAMKQAGTPCQSISVEGAAHNISRMPTKAREVEQATIRFLDEYLRG